MTFMSTEPLVELTKSDVPALLSIAFKLVDYVTQNWNAFVVLSGVMIGWRFAAKDHWTKKHKVIVTCLYALFVVVNFRALWVSYSWLSSVMSDLKIAGNSLNAQTPQLKGLLTNLYLQGGMSGVTVIYAVGVSLVLICFWLVKYPPESK
jgi:hypothetical protein